MKDTTQLQALGPVDIARDLVVKGRWEEAIRVLDCAAQARDVRAATYLGILQLHPDNPFQFDPDDGLAWLNYGFVCGIDHAGYWTGRYFERIGADENAFAWYQKAAERGHVSSTFRMGALAVRSDKLAPADKDRGQELLLDAARRGHVLASRLLADLWWKGSFGKRNYFQATKFLLLGFRQTLRLSKRGEFDPINNDLLR